MVARIIRTLVFSPAKNGFKSVISIFCCSVSVENISLHFQTFILPLIVIIQWDFVCTRSLSTQRSDLIIIQSVWNDMKKQNKLRQTKSRRTVATSPRCFKRPTCKDTILLKVLGTCVKCCKLRMLSKTTKKFLKTKTKKQKYIYQLTY